MSNQKTKIYLSFSMNLVFEICKNKIHKNKYLKNFYGIYLLTDNQELFDQNNLKEIEDNEYISYHILSLAYRFKRLKLNNYSTQYYSLPFSDNIQSSLRYIVSIINLIYKKYNLKDKNVEIYVNKFKDNYINIFLSRYLRKNYNIKVNFILIGDIIKPSNKLNFSYIKYKKRSIFSLFKKLPFRKERSLINFKDKTKLIINNINKNKNCPYSHHLSNENYINKSYTMTINELHSYGSNKSESFIFLLRNILKTFFEFSFYDYIKLIKYGLFLDYLQENLNKLYIHNLLLFFEKIKVDYLFMLHRAFALEKLIFKACKLSGITSVSFDWSLGYPVNNIFKKEISLMTRPDIYLVTSYLRQYHYEKANLDFLHAGGKLKIINCHCLQVEYARLKSKELCIKNKQNKDNLKNKLIISIFDNLYGENAGLQNKTALKFANILGYFKTQINSTLHSKDGIKNMEIALKQENINYYRSIKGDFSMAYKSNIIVSIGFQGSAIKAAFSFKKPLIFFSPEKDYFKDIYFLKDPLKNKKLISIFRKLTYTDYELYDLLSSEKERQLKIKNLKKLSKEFLELIGIVENMQFFLSYLKTI